MGFERFWVLSLVTWLGLGGVLGWAQDAPVPSSSFLATLQGGTTVRITSDRLLIQSRESRILFQGHVRLEREGFQLQAEEMEVRFRPAPEEGEGSQEIDRIRAKGNVRLWQGDRFITAEEVEYIRGEEKMIFTGDPVVREGNNEVRGRRITVYLQGDRAVVEGGTVKIQPPGGTP